MGRLSNSVDGVGIDNYKAVVSGAFEILDTDAQSLALDEEVMLVITVSVKAPRFKEQTNGELTRIAVLKAKEARVVRDPAMFSSLVNELVFEDAVSTVTPTVPAPAAFAPPSPALAMTVQKNRNGVGDPSEDEDEVWTLDSDPVRATTGDRELQNFLYG